MIGFQHFPWLNSFSNSNEIHLIIQGRAWSAKAAHSHRVKRNLNCKVTQFLKNQTFVQTSKNTMLNILKSSNITSAMSEIPFSSSFWWDHFALYKPRRALCSSTVPAHHRITNLMGNSKTFPKENVRKNSQ